MSSGAGLLSPAGYVAGSVGERLTNIRLARERDVDRPHLILNPLARRAGDLHIRATEQLPTVRRPVNEGLTVEQHRTRRLATSPMPTTKVVMPAA